MHLLLLLRIRKACFGKSRERQSGKLDRHGGTTERLVPKPLQSPLDWDWQWKDGWLWLGPTALGQSASVGHAFRDSWPRSPPPALPVIDPIPMRMQDLMSMSSSTTMCGSRGITLNAQVAR
jgi:hypothetical protein